MGRTESKTTYFAEPIRRGRNVGSSRWEMWELKDECRKFVVHWQNK